MVDHLDMTVKPFSDKKHNATALRFIAFWGAIHLLDIINLHKCPQSKQKLYKSSNKENSTHANSYMPHAHLN